MSVTKQRAKCATRKISHRHVGVPYRSNYVEFGGYSLQQIIGIPTIFSLVPMR